MHRYDPARQLKRAPDVVTQHVTLADHLRPAWAVLVGEPHAKFSAFPGYLAGLLMQQCMTPAWAPCSEGPLRRRLTGGTPVLSCVVSSRGIAGEAPQKVDPEEAVFFFLDQLGPAAGGPTPRYGCCVRVQR